MQGKRSLTLPCQRLCPSAVGEGSALGSPAPTKGNAQALQSSWKELQNAAGRAGTAVPHPAPLCHGAGIRREVSKAQERAGREEDALRRAKPVTTYKGHVLPPLGLAGTCKAARASKRGRQHRGANAVSRLGNGSRGSQATRHGRGLTRTPGRSAFTHTPCAPQTTLCPQDQTVEERTSCVLTPPHLLPRMNQYILTSDSPTPGGMLWLGRGRKN